MKKNQVNNIGLEVETPKKTCNSDKCPWHGHLHIRGRLFKGVVVSKTIDTVIVEWDYYNYVPKYERYERCKTRITAHNPKCLDVGIGDSVQISECRPLSKTKSFVVLSKIKKK